MIKREQQFRRALALLALVVLAFAGLGFRLVDLQVWRHDELAQQAEQNTQCRNLAAGQARRHSGCERQPARHQRSGENHLRGSFADRRPAGRRRARARAAVADERGGFVAAADSAHLRKIPKAKRSPTAALCPAPKKCPGRNLAENPGGDEPAFVWRGRKKIVESATAHFSRNLRQYAISAEPDQLRVYPNGALAAHVLGFVGTTENTNHTSEVFGCDGIEKSFNDKLERRAGWRVTGIGQPET